MNRRRLGTAVVGGLVVLWLLAALVIPVPTNPPVDPTAGLEALAPLPAGVGDVLQTSCFDCHSDQTRWPWYATVFPASWLLVRDVERGRGQMNFSRWSEYNVFDRADMLDDACAEVRNRTMPLPRYVWLHPDAALSEAEIELLCEWTAREAGRLAGGGEW